MYALCNNCGHGGDYFKSGPDAFNVFSPNADLTKMTTSDFLASGAELEVECPKCGGIEIQFLEYPPKGKKKES